MNDVLVNDHSNCTTVTAHSALSFIPTIVRDESFTNVVCRLTYVILNQIHCVTRKKL